ncbi:hypothetical protein NKH77_23780 [Streptomyces sp. M19]
MSSVSVKEAGAVQRVDAFYEAYIDAVRAGDTATAKELRAANLSQAAQKNVAKWESDNAADGVLHAQNARSRTRSSTTRPPRAAPTCTPT